MAEKKRPSVSIVIKAYNEERRIAAAIESALAALADFDGEVILADSASTDRTVEIAADYPIKIVRLNNPRDRSCGVGAQLGFQYSGGEYLCLMDGDMVLHAGFLEAGLRFLAQNPGVAGVGGAVVHRHVVNLEYQQRVNRPDPDHKPGPVTRLSGSGLYRRSALETVGYATDRNLHGGEELELAGRLHARGWTLARLDCVAVDHYCRTGSPYRLLFERIRSRNALGPGELMRSAFGQRQFAFIAAQDRNARLCGLVGLWWCSIAAVAALASGAAAALGTAALLLLPFASMAWRWRSLRGALYSVTVWNAQALCFLPGFFWPRISPANWIESRVVKAPPPAAAETRRHAGIVAAVP